MYKGLYVILALVLSGQFSWADYSQNQVSQSDLKKIIKEFTYPVQYELLDSKRTTGNGAACSKYEIQFKTDYPGNPNGEFVVDAILYIRNKRKTTNTDMPLVVQLPPMGGVNVLDKWMGQQFCLQEIATLIIQNDFTGFDDKNSPPVEDHDHAFKRTAASIKVAMEYGRQSDRIDGENVGFFGVSLGGILGSFVYGIFDSIKVGHFIVAGSDVPYILAHSDQKRVKKLRRIRMREEGFKSNDQYEDWLRQNILFDPFQTAQRIPPESVRMIISKKDKNVPTQKQWELHAQMGSPEQVVTKPASHVGTVIRALLWRSNREKIVKFFAERFALDNPRELIEEPDSQTQAFN